ncbi:MAG: hypothetical protein ACYTG3_20660 [Planctomycetota bacterium]
MTRILFAIVCVECAALLGGAGLHLTGGLERWARRPPRAPSFSPPVHRAVIGDLVRYERRDADGRVLGYLTYEVERAVEFEGTNLGREFLLRMTLTDKRDKRTRTRRIRLRPRAIGHGFLPPRFEEDDGYPQGARPVVKTIRPAKVPLFKNDVDGFLLEAVTPRADLTQVSERFWFSDRVAIFGVARWERPDEILVLHTMEKMRP